MLVRLHALLLPLPNVKHLLRTPNHRYESAVKSDPEQRIQELEAELERQRTTSKATQLHLETVQEELVATRERLANSERTTAELKVKVRSLEAQVEQSGAGKKSTKPTYAKSGGWQGGQ